MNGDLLREAIRIFIEEYSRELGLLPKTIKNKRNGLTRFLTFLGDKPLTLENVRAYILYMAEKGVVPSSIRQEIKYIKALLHFLQKRKYITRDENFSEEIDTPKVRKRVKQFISEELAEQVIISGTEPNPNSKADLQAVRTCLQFMLRHGVRISEAIRITAEDLNLLADEPFVMLHSKGGDYEQMPISTDFVPLLKGKTGKIFPVSEDSCNSALARGAKIHGIENKISCHSLRHIYALGRLRRGESLQLVSRTLRHSSVKITDDYYSQFNLTDLAPVVNNSPLIRKGLTIEQVFERLKRAVERSGVTKDERLTYTIKETENGLTISFQKK